MNNANAERLISECQTELDDIRKMLVEYGSFSNLTPYLTNYALVKASGTIEQSFKTIIADCCDKDQSQQIRNYVQNMFRESSRNSTIENIHKSLNEFDEDWNVTFKNRLSRMKDATRIRTSLKSLNQARNAFAHGGKTTISFHNVSSYFADALVVIEILDRIVV